MYMGSKCLFENLSILCKSLLSMCFLLNIFFHTLLSAANIVIIPEHSKDIHEQLKNIDDIMRGSNDYKQIYEEKRQK